MSQYGLKEEVLKIFSGIFDASLFMESHRLPELYCGFDRGEQEGPTLYPVACDPQAWAAGAVFMLLQACLGLVIRADNQKIYFNQPVLPAFLQEVVLNNFRIGPSVLDIRLRRYDTQGVGVQILHKEGPVEVVATK
jgi:glycogen debranching enzyme